MGEIVLKYSPASTFLEITGFSSGTGTGIQAYPDAATRAQGFTIGSAGDGTMPCQGLIDEFETFNYQLNVVDTYSQQEVLSASAITSPPAIKLFWKLIEPPAGTGQTTNAILRKRPEDSTWTTLVTNYTTWGYTDTNVNIGQRYEYNVAGRYILAAVNATPVEYRGRIILLVDNTMTNTLATELGQLTSDLVGDGWTVLRHDVPRHDEAVWANNTNNIAATKSLVLADYNSDPTNTKTVFILGHVAAPYSGFITVDAHPEHFGAWATDGYYGELTSIWSDTNDYPASYASVSLNKANMIGDGKFDQGYFPSALELAVGRVDFVLEPAFNGGQPAGVPAKNETDLLRQYLNKDHRFRVGQLSLTSRSIVAGYFNYHPDDDPVYQNSVRNGSRWFGAHRR